MVTEPYKHFQPAYLSTHRYHQLFSLSWQRTKRGKRRGYLLYSSTIVIVLSQYTTPMPPPLHRSLSLYFFFSSSPPLMAAGKPSLPAALRRPAVSCGLTVASLQWIPQIGHFHSPFSASTPCLLLYRQVSTALPWSNWDYHAAVVAPLLWH